MSIDTSIAASELNYQRLLEWNERYDAKTSIALALSTAMLGVVGAMTFGLPANALSFPAVWAAHSAISFPLGACILEVGRHILISILPLCSLVVSHDSYDRPGLPPFRRLPRRLSGREEPDPTRGVQRSGSTRTCCRHHCERHS